MKAQIKQIKWKNHKETKKMLNSIILTGRFTKDPLFTELKNGVQIAEFDIAVDNLGKDAGTTFLTCKAFNKLAVNVNEYCHKGSKVAVAGRIQQRSYLAKDGTKRSVYEILCDNIEFLDPKAKDEEPEEIQVVDAEVVSPEPKYDPMTGKPLKPSKK